MFESGCLLFANKRSQRTRERKHAGISGRISKVYHVLSVSSALTLHYNDHTCTHRQTVAFEFCVGLVAIPLTGFVSSDSPSNIEH